MGRVTVSAIIPTYNRAAFVRRALDSVMAQTLPPDEVIVVDDGSTDDTASVIHAAYREVTYLHQPSLGVSAARNRGIREATGSWIAFLDSDDTWLSGKLARQLEALHGNPEMKICHTDEFWIRDGRQVNPRKKHAKAGGWIFKRCLPLCCISPSSVMLHHSVFEAVGLFDEELPACEDYDFWLRVTSRFPVLFIDEKMIRKYGGHADQLSRRYWGMDRFRIRALEKILASGVLTSSEAVATRSTLLKKLEIYIQGARKRHNWEEVARYESKRRGALRPQLSLTA